MSKVSSDYPSNLTERQWKFISNLIPQASPLGRPRTTEMRSVVNAIFYLTRTGCAWRYLPHEFPNWRTVYDYFTKWCRLGIWRKICRNLHRLVRVICHHLENEPHYAIVDSQSIRAQYGEDRGFDAFKKVRGRKRHIMVDSLGIIDTARVSAADKRDQREAIPMIHELSFKKIESLYADGAYKGLFESETFLHHGVWPTLLISERKKKNPTRDGRVLLRSNLQPRRWIVERTFAWFNNYRRLARDYERRTAHSEATIYICMIMIILGRLEAT